MAGNAFLNLVNGVITMVRGVQVGGAGNANAIPALNGSGQLDITMMPTGIGPDTTTLVAFENINAGAFVDVFSNGGSFSCRNADATNTSKFAKGFALTAIATGASGTVYFNGTNTAVTGAVPGPVWLGSAGGFTQTPPAAAGQLSQLLGFAISATAINFTEMPAITLA